MFGAIGASSVPLAPNSRPGHRSHSQVVKIDEVVGRLLDYLLQLVDGQSGTSDLIVRPAQGARSKGDPRQGGGAQRPSDAIESSREGTGRANSASGDEPATDSETTSVRSPDDPNHFRLVA